MKVRKCLILTVVSAMLAVCLCAVSRGGPEYRIKIGSLVTPQSEWGKVVGKVIRKLEKQSGGRVKIEHLRSGMLGGGQSMMEMVLHGGIQGAGIPSANLAAVMPEMHVLELPFLFDDYDEAYYLIDNVLEPYLRKKLEEKGLLTSAFLENGLMEFVAPRFIHRPEDLKGLKIGCWESPVHIAFWEALDANPIPIPATEVMNAHARGIVDSGANTFNALIAWDHLFGTVIKREDIYITEVKYSYQAGILVMHKRTWESYPQDVRKMIMKSLSDMTVQLRKALREAEPKSRKELMKRGYQVTTMSPEEREVFIEKTKSVYNKFEKQVGKEFLKKVLEEREKYRESKKRAE
ncbi:MAG: TRAP transporter substrate-binding protein [bacterium]